MKSNNFEWLLPTPVKDESWRWGRYVGPLQVEFSPGTVTWVTESLVNAEVGQRVLVRFYSGTRATIMGVLGGIGQGGLKFGTQRLTTENLNDITRGGFYRQNLSANATFARNYPATVAGLLEVFDGGNMIWQRYTLYSGSGNSSGVYNRRRYNGTWYKWEQLRGTNDGNTIWINGTPYPSSGVVDSPGWTVARTDGKIYTGNMDVTQPFAPPAGWTFNWSAQGTTGYTFVSTAGGVPSGGKQTLRVMQVGNNSTTALRQLAWQLVKL